MANRSIFLTAALLASSTSLAEVLPRFPSTAVWYQNVESATLHPDSASQINTLSGLGGFGLGRMQMDFGIHVVRAPASSPTRTMQAINFDQYFLPDCDDLGTDIPVPTNSAIEAVTDLDCDNQGEDCHLLVVQGNDLFEIFRANRRGAGGIEGQCLAVWDLTVEYPPEGRGEHCTSADAAGFPIAPMLVNADEVAASLAADPAGNGDLGHALRFILPNNRMASDNTLGGVGGRLYVRPASHAGAPSGPVGSVAYGSRLRLRSNFPLNGYNPAARVILNTLKRYGMLLADGGSITLTAESDLYTDASWDSLGVTSRIFDSTSGATDVDVTDFEVIDTGPRIAETFNCVRTIIPEGPSGVIFLDGFEN